jgi:hypothetical protein
MKDNPKDDMMKLTPAQLEQVTGGNYEGPIAYDEIDEKAELLEWILATYGMEDALCACGGFYYDPVAKNIFKTQGAKAWAEYVKKNYDPNAGLTNIVEED